MELDERYYRLADIILDWNEKINVTAIRDKDEFIQKNIIDSLTIAVCPEISRAERILDMGTGGGFPGLPLAIAYPEKKFVLVDAVGKKLKVVADAAAQLSLKNVEVIHARAEDLAKKADMRESFDLVTSRAVANLATLSEYCLPFVKMGGHFVAYKTKASLFELDDASNAIKLLGGKKIAITDDGIEGSDHLFITIIKEKSTPKMYPRKAGLPSKEPIK